MHPVVTGFVDVGFVRAVVADAHALERPRVRLDAAAIVRLVEKIAIDRNWAFLRTYWYDGQYLPEDPRYATQLKYLDAVSQVPGLRLRLGQLIERTPAWHADLNRALAKVDVDPAEFAKHFSYAGELVQKGVDTLMVLDLVLQSQTKAYDIAVLMTGDRDLSEAVRTIQDFGRRVILVVPPGRSVAAPLRALADEVITLDLDTVRSLHLGSRPREGGTSPRSPHRSEVPRLVMPRASEPVRVQIDTSQPMPWVLPETQALPEVPSTAEDLEAPQPA